MLIKRGPSIGLSCINKLAIAFDFTYDQIRLKWNASLKKFVCYFGQRLRRARNSQSGKRSSGVVKVLSSLQTNNQNETCLKMRSWRNFPGSARANNWKIFSTSWLILIDGQKGEHNELTKGLFSSSQLHKFKTFRKRTDSGLWLWGESGHKYEYRACIYHRTHACLLIACEWF